MKTKRSIYNLFFNLLSQIITFAMSILIPRLFLVSLGSEINGLVSSVGQVFSYVGLLEAGIGATAIQALYKPIVEKNQVQINRILSASNKHYKKIGFIYIGCVIVVAIFYPIFVVSDIPNWQIVGVVIFSGLGNAINFLLQQNYVVLLSAEGRGYVTTNLNLLVNVLASLTKAVLLLLGFNVVVITAAQFSFTLLRILLMQIYIYKNYKWINTKEEPDYSALSKQKYVMVQQLSYFIYSNTDILVLTVFCDLSVVSVYVIYNLIIGVIEGIVSAFTSSILFALGQIYNEDFKKFKKIYNIYDSGYMTIVFALFTVVYLCFIPFLSVYTRGITDANYLDHTLALLFVILKMVTTLRSQSQNTIYFAGHFKETHRSAILEAVINIVVSLISVNYVGIYGVLIGSIVSTLYRGIVVTNYSNKYILKYNHIEKNKKYIRWIVYIAAFTVICFIANGGLPKNMANYYEWMCMAMSCTIMSAIIYGVLWILIDRRVVMDAFEIVKSIVYNRKNMKK